ncbi:MAG: hypothetical protein M5U14_16575 [Acidimicrobiia bacterium]|nr:hypothetical protein [Acidimicrobiia bacterium]
MSVVLVAGAGAVGVRAARQLVETPGVEKVVVAERRGHRGEAVARALGDRGEALRWRAGDPLPDGLDVVVSALPTPADVRALSQAVEAGVPAVSSADDHRGLEQLLGLDGAARAAGVGVLVGCGLAPGLADVLARHAAGALDEVDEVHVARCGAAGRASVAAVERALHERPVDWVEGGWRTGRRPTRELVWFPDPVGAQECATTPDGVALLVRAFPGLARASVRLGEPPRSSRWRRPGARRHHDESSWGAVRVEVWGRRGTAREVVVYGVIERTAVAAGTVLAVAAATLAGLVPGAGPGLAPGVHGLAEAVAPVPFLAELSHRGVKAAVFEGVGVH